LARFVEFRGGDNHWSRLVLAGQSPRERAAQLIAGTRLGSPDFRRELAAGGEQAIDSSDDPIVQLAREMEPEFRRIREIEDELEEIERQAYADITRARVALEGTAAYPDATFTLRLALGVVKGYEEDGRQIPPWTTLGGAFEHAAAHEERPPWNLPGSWLRAKSRLDPSTPLNFVSTSDIIGGNSGSPVVNRAAELVGVIFDGNIQSLTAGFYYSEKQARAVAVDARAIRECLNEIYSAGALAAELGH
jgi:hypothetical protein